MPTLTVDIPVQTLTQLAMELSGFAGLMKLMTALKMRLDPHLTCTKSG